MPLFTILTPVYNHASYLEDCIRSVVEQTFPGWEMIIIDDGSTDGSDAIVQQWIAKDDRIRMIRQENQGIFRLAETYNRGLREAGGKYISILEGDDRWEPDKLQRQSEILENSPDVVVAWGRAARIQAGSGGQAGVIPPEGAPVPAHWSNDPAGSVLESLYIENFIPAVTITFRRTALEQCGGFVQPPDFPTTDLPTLLEMALLGKFHFDPKVIAAWRVYSGQTTKRFPVEMLTRRWNHCLGHYRQLDGAIKSRLKITDREIDQYFRSRMVVAYATSGRYRLIRKEFPGARRDYLKAIFYPSWSYPVWRLRAITGLVLSLFHKDVEGLSAKLGKVTYKS
jgi:glycosyltransferase involved in cell wall biosynthesis